MPDYQRMYAVLFNAITTVLGMLKEGRVPETIFLLKQAQRQAEELRLSTSGAGRQEGAPALDAPDQ